MPPRPSRPPPLAQANAILQKAVEVKLPLNRKRKAFLGECGRSAVAGLVTDRAEAQHALAEQKMGGMSRPTG
jgi:hypothetical protein